MLYINSDRTHVDIEAYAALSAIINILPYRLNARNVTTRATLKAEPLTFGYSLTLKNDTTLNFQSCVSNGVLQIAFTGEATDEMLVATIFRELSGFMGGFFTLNNGTVYRIGSLPSEYDKRRADKLKELLQVKEALSNISQKSLSATHDLIATLDSLDGTPIEPRAPEDTPITPEEALSALPLLANVEGFPDGLDAVSDMAYSHFADIMSVRLFRGSRSDFVKEMRKQHHADQITVSGGILVVKSLGITGVSVRLYRINDMSTLDPTTRLFFRMNPETLRDHTIISTPEAIRFEAEDIEEFVAAKLKQKREVANAQNFALGAVKRGIPANDRNKFLFKKSDYEALAKCCDGLVSDGIVKSTALYDIMCMVKDRYTNIRVHTIPDISGNPIFDTVRISIDGCVSSVVLGSEYCLSLGHYPLDTDYICIDLSQEPHVTTPVAEIISTFLEDAGGVRLSSFKKSADYAKLYSANHRAITETISPLF